MVMVTELAFIYDKTFTDSPLTQLDHGVLMGFMFAFPFTGFPPDSTLAGHLFNPAHNSPYRPINVSGFIEVLYLRSVELIAQGICYQLIQFGSLDPP